MFLFNVLFVVGGTVNLNVVDFVTNSCSLFGFGLSVLSCVICTASQWLVSSVRRAIDVSALLLSIILTDSECAHFEYSSLGISLPALGI